jgi:YwiC-like protein
MATQAGILQSPRLKSMVIPREHGAWGMLLVPLATGAVIAVGSSAHYGALAVFVFTALDLFWLRTPVEAWLGTTPMKAQSPSERATVMRIALWLAVAGALAIGWLFAAGYAKGLLLIGTIAAAAFLLQIVVKGIGRAGRMPSQVIGAAGLTATAAAAYYVTSGKLERVACALWAANWLFAGNQVHFVQIRIRGSRVATSADKVRHAYGFLAGQVLLLALIFVGSRIGFFPRFTVIAFVPVLLRGSLWFLRDRESLDVHRLGFSELFQALLFGVLLCAVFLL